MQIAALHKTTLLDFPGKVSALVFVQGCNFRCPYCHNPELLPERPGTLTSEAVEDFLAQRKKLLEGLVVSGGEPTLQDDLPDFCARIKHLGYAVKLDTNGSQPEILRELLEHGLLDYVALDIKADPHAYPPVMPAGSGEMPRSIRLLESFGVEHEFRVPCALPFITPAVFSAILRLISGTRRSFCNRYARNAS